MTAIDPVLVQMREICLALPNTKETITWGTPHFRVGDKIFAGYGEEKGKSTIGFKLEMDHADMVIQDPRFWRAPYVGHKGWVSMDVSQVSDWDEVRELIWESYRLIAPKRLLKQIESGEAASKPAADGAAKKAAAKGSGEKGTAKKAAAKASEEKGTAKKAAARASGEKRTAKKAAAGNAEAIAPAVAKKRATKKGVSPAPLAEKPAAAEKAAAGKRPAAKKAVALRQ